MRRVVITGLGMVSPLGADLKTTWRNLLANKSGIRRITEFYVSDIPAKVAGLVPRGEGGFNPDLYMEPKEQRKVDPFILYGVAASVQAIEDSGWKAETEEDQGRTGVMIGSGIGGLTRIYDASVTLHEQGPLLQAGFVTPMLRCSLMIRLLTRPEAAKR